MSIVVLFDDERRFKPGFRDDAIVLRTVSEAEEAFSKLEVIDELWLDFVLSPGSTIDAFHSLKGIVVKKIIFHSSAYMARELVKLSLQRYGVYTEVELPEDHTVLQRFYN